MSDANSFDMSLPVDLIQKCINEIALEGLRGCSADHLWQQLLLTSTPPLRPLPPLPPPPMPLDDAMKQYLWRALVRSPHVEFWKLQNGGEEDQSSSSSPSASSPYSMEGFLQVKDRNKRQRMTNEQEGSLLENGQPNADQQNSLVMVARSPLRFHILGITVADRKPNDLQYCILEAVARARHTGIWQMELGLTLLMDAKTVNYNLQRLESWSLIKRTPGYDKKNHVVSNVIYHAMFFDDQSHAQRESQAQQEVERDLKELDALNNWDDYMYLRNRIEAMTIELLRGKKGNALLERDVRKHFLGQKLTDKVRHRWEKLRSFMTRSGEINIAQAIIGSSKTPMNVVMLANSTQSSLTDASEEASPLPEMAENGGFCAEIPQLYQLYRAIQTSNNGVTLPMLADRFFIDKKKNKALLDNLRDMYGVIAQAEKIGKQTVYRYTIPSGDRDVIDVEDVDDDSEMARTVLKREDNEQAAATSVSNVAEETTATGSQTAAREPRSTTTATAQTDVMDTTSDGETERQVTRDTSTDEPKTDEAKYSSLSRVIITDGTFESPGKRQVSSFSKRGAKHKSTIRTKQLDERTQKIVNILKEKNAITSEDLSRALSEDKKMERKTVRHILRHLENQGLAKTFTVSFPTPQGTHKQHRVLMNPELTVDDEVMKKFIENLKTQTMTSTRIITKLQTIELDDIDELFTSQSRRKTKERSGIYSSYHAIRQGYITARMQRLKLFHQFLAKLTQTQRQQDIQGKDQSESSRQGEDGGQNTNPNDNSGKSILASQPLSLYQIVQGMSFSLFRKIVGITNEVKELAQYENNEDIALLDIPEEIRKRIAANTRVFINNRIGELLKQVAKLGLVKTDAPQSNEIEQQEGQENHMYVFQTTATLPNFKLVKPKKTSFELETMDDVDQYWSALEKHSHQEHDLLRETSDSHLPSQSSSENGSSRKNKKKKATKHDHLKNTIFEEIPMLSSGNWTELKHFTIRQLRILEDQYSKDERPNGKACRMLAKQIARPIEQVVLYFYRHRSDILSRRINANSNQRKRVLSQTVGGRKRHVTTRLHKHSRLSQTSSSTSRRRQDSKVKWTDEEYALNSSSSSSSSSSDVDEESDEFQDVWSKYDSEEELSDDDDQDGPQPVPLSQQRLQGLSNMYNRSTALHARAYKKRQRREQNQSEPWSDRDSSSSERDTDAGGDGSDQDVELGLNLQPIVDSRATGKRKKRKEKKEQKEPQQPKRARRIRWKVEEDLQLLCGLAKYRTLELDGSTFSKSPIQWDRIISEGGLDRDIEQCRRRWRILNNLTWCKTAVLRAAAFYQLNKAALDEANADQGEEGQQQITDVELTNQVMKILREYTHKEIGPDTMVVPNDNITSSLWNSYRSVKLPPLPRDASQFGKHIEILYSNRKDLFTPIAALQRELFTCEEGYLRSYCVEALLKVIYLTPEAEYHVGPAHALLREFTPEEIQEAMTTLTTKGFLTKSRKRGLHMRGFTLTHNFMASVLTSTYPPDLFVDAKRFAQQLLHPGENGEYDESDEDNDIDEEEALQEQPLRRVSLVEEPPAQTLAQLGWKASSSQASNQIAQRRDGVDVHPSDRYIERLYFNHICTGGEIAASLTLLATNKIRFIPEFDSVSQQIQDTTYDSSGATTKIGVSAHLLKVGGFVASSDVRDGTSFRNLRLPDWDIEINLTEEPDAVNHEGLYMPKMTRAMRRFARSKLRRDVQIEYNIERSQEEEVEEEEEREEKEVGNIANENNHKGQKRQRDQEDHETSGTAKRQRASEETIQTDETATSSATTVTTGSPIVVEVSESENEDDWVRSKVAEFPELSTLLFYSNGVTLAQAQEERRRIALNNIVQVYKTIEQRGKFGIPLETLREQVPNVMQEEDAVEDILSQLTNFEVVRMMDLRMVTVYIAHKHSDLCMVVPFEVSCTGNNNSAAAHETSGHTGDASEDIEQHSSSSSSSSSDKNNNNSNGETVETESIQYLYDKSSARTISPWMKLNGRVNVELLHDFKQALLETISLRPGVSLKQIVSGHTVLDPLHIARILEVMENEGLVYTKCTQRKKPSLFSSGRSLFNTANGAPMSDSSVRPISDHSRPLSDFLVERDNVRKSYFASVDCLLRAGE